VTASVTLSVFSDAHLALGLPRGRELLGKRALSALSWRMKRRWLHDGAVARAAIGAALSARCDAAVSLGDIVNFGLAREFEAAAAMLRDLGAGDHFAAIPGNHEAMAPGWAAPLRSAWGEWLTGEGGAAQFPWLRRVGAVALIGVSSAVATPPFCATGRVGGDQLARLTALLAETGRAGLARVVLIHHPPTAIAPARKALADAAAVRAALRDKGAELVLHGHLHRFSLSWIGDPPQRIPVIGAPSVSMRADAGGDAAGGWLSVRLTREAGRWRAAVTPHGAGGADATLVFALPAQPCASVAA